MREIEFRGKRKDNGEWVCGFLMPGSMINDPDYLVDYWIATGHEDQCYPIITETVGQYTGLTDKNGAKIFEGAIVLRRYTESSGIEVCNKYLVVFENGSFLIKRIDSFYPSGLSPESCGLYKDYTQLLEITRDNPAVNGSYEVIGNIHDNPELLSREKIIPNAKDGNRRKGTACY